MNTKNLKTVLAFLDEISFACSNKDQFIPVPFFWYFMFLWHPSQKYHPFFMTTYSISKRWPFNWRNSSMVQRGRLYNRELHISAFLSSGRAFVVHKSWSSKSRNFSQVVFDISTVLHKKGPPDFFFYLTLNS